MADAYERELMENTFANVIHKNLGVKSLDTIKRRLFEKHGISLHQAVNDEYGKLFDILNENFSEGGANNIEKQFRKSLMTLRQRTFSGKPVEKIISKPDAVKRILKYLGDKDMMLIIDDVMDKPKLVSEVLKSCKLPQTSCYRKINQLVEAGLLVISGFVIGSDGRQIFRYTTSFDGISVFIEGKKSKIRITPKKIGKNSYLPIPFI